MKTLKTGDTITISKPGLLNGSTGKIIEIDETKRKPIKALVDNGGGEWQLEYSEVQNNAPQALKSSETAQQINTDELTPEKISAISKMGMRNVSNAIQKENAKECKKPGRKPKGQVKPIKEKRKYIRKNLA